MLKNYIKRHKYMFTFLIGLFVIGIIIGVFLYFFQGDNIKISIATNLNDIKDQLLTNHINNYYLHLIIIVLIAILSLTVFGYFGGLFYFFYEGMSIGFTCTYLTLNKGLNGLIFGITYNIIFKLVFLSLLLLILLKLFDIVKNIIGFIIYKNNANLLMNF